MPLVRRMLQPLAALSLLNLALELHLLLTYVAPAAHNTSM